LRKNTIKTGIKSLDESVLITSGMMISLLAAPGAGKTSFANLFVENLSQNGENTLFFSLDMYQPLLFSRLLQKHCGYSAQVIMDMFESGSMDEPLIQAFNQVLEDFSNVNFCFKTGPTVEEIEQEILRYQKQSGKKVKLLVLDYLEKIRGPFADSTANSAYIASRVSDLAKKYHLAVLLLVQPSKMAGDPRDELNSYRKIKGSSVIEQDSRVVLTLSRPGYNPQDMSKDKFACISVVKNNMGPLTKLDYAWDGVAGQFSELDSAGRVELRKLRQELENIKKDEFDI
jgi:replicative DNA helicase